jgi:perosamine synthetase
MIPLSVPNLSGNEWQYVKDCLDTNWVSSVGSYVTLFEKKAAEFCGVKYAVATSNGTAALHICLLLAGVKKSDLVILPNITFVAPANAITYTGADPLLMDVNRDTWQMDINLLSRFLDEHTSMENDECIHRETGRRISAIVPVHVLGNICDMDALVSLAKKWNITIVEDSTEALGSYYKGKHAGSMGTFGCLSFNGNKIITTGGGGMILCNDEALAKKAKHLTTQAKADPDEYYHDEIGYNYRLVNILAAMGVAQMEQLPGFLERKKEITDKYNRIFEKISGCFFQKITEGVKQNNWLYTVGVPRQKELRAHFKKNNIEVRPFWMPMNQLPSFKNAIYYNNEDVSGNIYSNCLSIPCSTGLTDKEQEEVIGCIRQFYND